MPEFIGLLMLLVFGSIILAVTSPSAKSSPSDKADPQHSDECRWRDRQAAKMRYAIRSF